MRDLIHPNLNTIIGLCTDFQKICIIYPYCKKGSLSDLLLNEDMQLDWAFRNTFIVDIASVSKKRTVSIYELDLE